LTRGFAPTYTPESKVLNARLNILLALVLGGGLGQARAFGEELDPIVSSLESRTDRSSIDRTIEVLEKLGHDAGAHPLRVGEAILQTRFFRAEYFLKGDGQVDANGRNVVDGLSRLSRLTGERLQDFGQLDERLAVIPPQGAGLLFWTALSFGRTIESMSVFSRAGAAKRFRRALDRVITLDATYFHGMPHAALSMYLARAPGFMGGNSDLALKEAKRAIEVDPSFADNYLNYAEVLHQTGGDVQVRRDALEKALGQRDDGPPGASAEQRMAKSRARVLLKEIEK
jgi:hypothetical protein